VSKLKIWLVVFNASVSFVSEGPCLFYRVCHGHKYHWPLGFIWATSDR